MRFVSEYYMDTQGFFSFSNAFFITFIVIMVLIVLIRIGINYNQSRLSVDPTAKMQYTFVQSITLTMDIYSTIFFWFMFAMCGWWFIFYKLQ